MTRILFSLLLINSIIYIDVVFCQNSTQVKVEKTNLGTNINSAFSETGPIITSDGKTLYFVSRRSGGQGNQDIWFSTINESGNWTEAKNIGKKINNYGPNNVISVSPDGNKLLVTNRYDKYGNYSDAGASITTRTEKGWSIPKPVNIKLFYNLNQFLGFCLSPDQKVLISYCERKDGFGGLDLYYSKILEDGSWSEPISLGVIINSKRNEATPFIAADNRTMYFASNGLHNRTDFDIYMARRIDTSWTNWTIPVNLGPEINSGGFDAYFSIPASGDSAYLVSNMNTFGREDIFKINLPDKLKPLPVALVFGKVLRKTDSLPIHASIEYKSINKNTENGQAISHPTTGHYQIVLPIAGNYEFYANEMGYYPLSDNIDLTNYSSYVELERDLYLVPISEGSSFTLNNLLFEFNSSSIILQSYSELNRLYNLMKKNPEMHIKISGHTDSIGETEFNKQLSIERSKAVANYLFTKNINQERIEIEGLGESIPVANNIDTEGRQKNRRVEIKIIKL